MRNWNKLLALVLAMVMVFGLTATSFATEADDDKKEDTTATDTTTPSTDEDKTDDATPAETEDKADDATPAETEDKTDDATPAETEDKTDDATPADTEDKTDDADAADKTDDAADAETTEPADETDYSDVAEWAREGVAYVFGQKKLIANREAGMELTATMTRAEMVAALYALAGAPAVEIENEFTDVADTASYKDAVVWAVANNITNGLGDGTFNPDGVLTRQHIAVFLYRYVKNVAKGDTTVEDGNLAVFPDAADAADWAAAELNWAVANKIINGVGDKLEPNGSAQRQQVAVMLYRYITEVLPAAPADDDAADADKADDAGPDTDKADADAADADKADDAADDAADKADDTAADTDKADDDAAADADKADDAADADKAAE